MSLLGIDVGTTGCKAALFSETGQLLASAYAEYDVQRPQPGWAELDAPAVWEKVKRVICQVTQAVSQNLEAQSSPIKALAVSSLGEAMVPVTNNRQILGPSLLNFDARGAEYLDTLAQSLPDSKLYALNGNTLGNHYGLTKLLWLRDHRPSLYAQADKFLLWGSFIPFMLGADPVVDYSLANRTLLFDLHQHTWSSKVLNVVGLDQDKLPRTAPSGTAIGTVAQDVAEELGLPPHVTIVTGAHDQCANAVGCGVAKEGQATYGIGTVICITPVFSTLGNTATMIKQGLNTEHHAVPEKFVSFIYNQGGALVKWFRDTFAATDHARARQAGEDIYEALFKELPDEPSGLMVLPHFTTTGPPDFISDSRGVITGLRLETTRGQILKAIGEGATVYLKTCVESLPETGITLQEYRAVGGGSKSTAWVQISADIMGQPFTRPQITEAGTLGAAIISGVGVGHFPSFEAGIEAMVKLERVFEPRPQQHQRYRELFEDYKRLKPIMQKVA